MRTDQRGKSAVDMYDSFVDISFPYEMTWDYCIPIIAFLINGVESWSRDQISQHCYSEYPLPVLITNITKTFALIFLRHYVIT